MARLALVIVLCTLLRAQSGAVAFLTKESSWHVHPEVPNLQIGFGTVVILDKEGGAVRYMGQVWEYPESHGWVYGLETHGGFVADVGGWRRSDVNHFVVEFKDTFTSMVLPAPPSKSKEIQVEKSCRFSSLLTDTTELICGARKLKKIRLKTVPQALLEALKAH